MKNIETQKYKIKKLGKNEASVGGLLCKVIECDKPSSSINKFRLANRGSEFYVLGKLKGMRLILLE